MSLVPMPGMQSDVVNSDVTEAFIGGARGAGATTAIFMAWEKHLADVGGAARGVVAFPFYNMARFHFDEMVRELAPGCRAHLVNLRFDYDNGASLSLSWTGEATGVKLFSRFCFPEASFLAFDNADWYESQSVVDDVCSIVRPVPRVKYRRIITGHPPICPDGPSWLRDRYVGKAPDGEEFWRKDSTSPTLWTKCRFFPAAATSNGFLWTREMEERVALTFGRGSREWNRLYHGEWVEDEK